MLLLNNVIAVNQLIYFWQHLSNLSPIQSWTRIARSWNAISTPLVTHCTDLGYHWSSIVLDQILELSRPNKSLTSNDYLKKSTLSNETGEQSRVGVQLRTTEFCYWIHLDGNIMYKSPLVQEETNTSKAIGFGLQKLSLSVMLISHKYQQKKHCWSCIWDTRFSSLTI